MQTLCACVFVREHVYAMKRKGNYLYQYHKQIITKCDALEVNVSVRVRIHARMLFFLAVCFFMFGHLHVCKCVCAHLV